jgi:mycothiol system anti-sigma-R factor
VNADCGADCQEALAQLEAYLDGELGEDAKERISGHLAQCFPCADRASFDEQLRAMVRERCAETAPPHLLDRIRLHLGASDA